MDKIISTPQNQPKEKSTNVRMFNSIFSKSLGLLYKLAPFSTNKFVTEFLFHPKLMPEKKIYKQWSDKAQTTFLPVNNTQHFIKVYKWGEGPAVLLVHGWAGRGLQLHNFIQPLLDKGHSVIAFDAPAHGESTGVATNYFEFHLSVNSVIKHFKNIEIVIGHSMGCGAVTSNLKEFSSIKKAVLIAPQYDIKKELTQWSEKVLLGKENFLKILNYLEQKYQIRLADVNPKNMASQIDTDILLVHDREDIPCSHVNSIQLAKEFENNHVYLTKNLGHYRILKDKKVVNHIIEFIDTKLIT